MKKNWIKATELKEISDILLKSDIKDINSLAQQVTEGGIFVALQGARYDGRDFVATALARGAKIVIIQADDEKKNLENVKSPQNLQIKQLCRGKALLLELESPRKIYSFLAKKIFLPQIRAINSKIPHFFAITGTNGKTSSAYNFAFLSSILGYTTVYVGTLGIFLFTPRNNNTIYGCTTPDIVKIGETNLTSPHAADIYRAIIHCAQNNECTIDRVIIEASSHALEQFRLDFIPLRAACFTNLSHDHLDYHSNMSEYFAAKMRLFTEILPQNPYKKPRHFAIINTDNAHGRLLQQAIILRNFKKSKKLSKKEKDKQNTQILTCGYSSKATIQMKKYVLGKYCDLILNFGKKKQKFRFFLPYIALFQFYNFISALTLLISAEDKNPKLLLRRLQAMHQSKAIQVPGRLEAVKSFEGKEIFIDYAHSPEALMRSLQAIKQYIAADKKQKYRGKLNNKPKKEGLPSLRSEKEFNQVQITNKIHKTAQETTREEQLCTSRYIWLVFGCGGNRDRAKRKIMGQIAANWADKIIITDDNPRDEDPKMIRHEIMQGCPQALEIGDRKAAIHYAIKTMKEDDILLIAGKGHENQQIIGKQNHQFSDKDTVITALGENS